MTLWGSAVQIRSSLPISSKRRRLAQLGERFLHTEEVNGSIPLAPTKFVSKTRRYPRFCFLWDGHHGSPGTNSHDHAARRLDASRCRRARRSPRSRRGIGPRLAKDALGGKLDGKLVDLATPVTADATVEIVTPKSPDALDLYRHSTAHLTAQRRQAPLPDGPDRHRPGDRERLLLRLQPGAPVHARGPRRDRGRDAEDRRRGQPRSSARRCRRTRRSRIFEAQKDALKVEIIRGIPDEQGLLLPAEGLHRPLPRAARPLDRQARRLQADAHGRRVLEGRREEPDAPAHLRRLAS